MLHLYRYYWYRYVPVPYDGWLSVRLYVRFGFQVKNAHRMRTVCGVRVFDFFVDQVLKVEVF